MPLMAEHFDNVATLAVRLLLLLIFAAAVRHKLIDFSRFRDTVRDYRLVPASMTGTVALALAALELAVIAALLLPASANIGVLLAMTLLLAYTTAIGINLARGRRHIDCGCSGLSASQPIGPGLLVRNLLLAALAALALRRSGGAELASLDIGIAAVAALAAALLYAAVGELLANAPRLEALRNRYE